MTPGWFLISKELCPHDSDVALYRSFRQDFPACHCDGNTAERQRKPATQIPPLPGQQHRQANRGHSRLTPGTRNLRGSAQFLLEWIAALPTSFATLAPSFETPQHDFTVDRVVVANKTLTLKLFGGNERGARMPKEIDHQVVLLRAGEDQSFDAL